jgi:hypothetical protein
MGEPAVGVGRYSRVSQAVSLMARKPSRKLVKSKEKLLRSDYEK